MRKKHITKFILDVFVLCSSIFAIFIFFFATCYQLAEPAAKKSIVVFIQDENSKDLNKNSASSCSKVCKKESKVIQQITKPGPEGLSLSSTQEYPKRQEINIIPKHFYEDRVNTGPSADLSSPSAIKSEEKLSTIEKSSDPEGLFLFKEKDRFIDSSKNKQKIEKIDLEKVHKDQSSKDKSFTNASEIKVSATETAIDKRLKALENPHYFLRYTPFWEKPLLYSKKTASKPKSNNQENTNALHSQIEGKIAKKPKNSLQKNKKESQSLSSTTKIGSSKKATKPLTPLDSKTDLTSVSKTEEKFTGSSLEHSKKRAQSKPKKLLKPQATPFFENKTEIIFESPSKANTGKVKITINSPIDANQQSSTQAMKVDSSCCSSFSIDHGYERPIKACCQKPCCNGPDSCCQEPCCSTPCCETPCAPDPCCQQPCCQEPCCSTPCCETPCAPDPCCQQPCCQNPKVIEPPIDQLYYRSDVSRCCRAYFTAGFIYWSTYQEGLSFAVSGFGVGVEKGCVSDEDWEWRPGYVLGIGYDLGCYWNLNANYTWIQSCNGKEITQEPYYVEVENCDCGSGNSTTTEAKTSLVSYWNVNNQFHDNLTSAEAYCDVYFNDIHLDFERLFCINRCLRMKLLFGLEGAWIYQDYHAKYRNTLNEQANLYMSQDFWGIGPRGGVQMSWYFSRRFSIYGDISFASIWNCFSVHRKDQEISAENPNKVLINTCQTLYGIDPVVDMGIGLRAENCYFTLEIGWQSQVWFDHNKYIKFSPGHDGDLILQGLTMEVSFMF